MSTEATNAKTEKGKSFDWGGFALDVGVLALRAIVTGAAGAAGAYAFNNTASLGTSRSSADPSGSVLPIKKSSAV